MLWESDSGLLLKARHAEASLLGAASTSTCGSGRQVDANIMCGVQGWHVRSDAVQGQQDVQWAAFWPVQSASHMHLQGCRAGMSGMLRGFAGPTS